MFETLRNGAENYFQDTKRNYFNDFTYLHNFLGLSYVHKNAVLIFSLVRFLYSFLSLKITIEMFILKIIRHQKRVSMS